MKKLLIIGAGGFALEVLYILRDLGTYHVVGLIDREADKPGATLEGVPIVGNDETLADWRADGVPAVVITVAAWRVRKRLFAQAAALGFELPALIHPTAYLAANVTVGAGSIVYPGVVIMPGCQLGRGVLVNAGATLGHEVITADFCNINPGANVAGRVSLGEGVLVGIGSVILEGHCIGEGARVGAGAVVTKDIAANTTVIGIPARPMEFTQQEGQP